MFEAAEDAPRTLDRLRADGFMTCRDAVAMVWFLDHQAPELLIAPPSLEGHQDWTPLFDGVFLEPLRLAQRAAAGGMLDLTDPEPLEVGWVDVNRLRDAVTPGRSALLMIEVDDTETLADRLWAQHPSGRLTMDMARVEVDSLPAAS